MRNFIIIITTAFLAVAFCIASNTPTTVPLTAVETQLRKTSQEGIKSSVVVTGKHSNDWGTRNIGGTGIIVRHNYVFTCSHVLGNTYYPKITLPSGEIVTGEVMVEDPDRDMALIKIESKEKLTVCRFSETPPEVGDIILVVGSPHGYHKTVTMGVVSHTDRNITMPNDITLKRLIQTDAAINTGNSGGPALNLRGEIVGAVVAIRDGSQGIGFLIPARTLKKFVDNNVE